MAKFRKYKKIQNKVKKVNPITMIFIVIFAIIGVSVGVGVSYYFTRNDVFKINGETEITLNIGDSYIEDGATAIAFGKNISSSVKIDGEVDTTKEGRYVIKYTVDNFRFKNYVLYKLVIVEPVGE